MMDKGENIAPGGPGDEPVWMPGRKSAVGTARSPLSRVWFTLGEGVLHEIYFRRPDNACVQNVAFIITGKDGFLSEEGKDTDYDCHWLAPGIPAFSILQTCKHARYRIAKEILTDPERHVLLQRIRFEAMQGNPDDYHLHLLLDPHMNNQGWGNTAFIGDYKGIPMLMAERKGVGLAASISAPWLARSAGYTGRSDARTNLRTHKAMTWNYSRAENGNVALAGEIDLHACGGEFVLAVGFGENPSEAGHRAHSSLLRGFEHAKDIYLRQWRRWQSTLLELEPFNSHPTNVYRAGAAVIACHESKDFPGAIIAGLAYPWGQVSRNNTSGGYHLLWPRDMWQSAGALIAAGAHEAALRSIEYFQATQEPDGHWPQNMWIDGSPHWNGIQLDETAGPILLVELALRYGQLGKQALEKFQPFIRKAAQYIVRHGPTTEQDRWERTAGFTPFTVACEIAALLVAADCAERNHDSESADYLRETADAWNDSLEDWFYVMGTEPAKKFQVRGYYQRITPFPNPGEGIDKHKWIDIPNRKAPHNRLKASETIGVDALAFVRFGLRSADDPKILDTLKVVDGLLKVETPHGPVWRRYVHDGYGEHEDGSPFDGTGVGRPWPLLTGERAHYELAAGHFSEARRLADTLEAIAGREALLPEQVWDGPPLPAQGLRPGEATFSARPLVWAHAEHIKLLRSLQLGNVFDRPLATYQRYIATQTPAKLSVWRHRLGRVAMAQGKILRVEAPVTGKLRWSADDWRTFVETQLLDSGLGIFHADLPTRELRSGGKIVFTFFWTGVNRWEGRDYWVEIK